MFSVSKFPLPVTHLLSAAVVASSLLYLGTAGGAQAKTAAPAGHSFSGYSHHYHDRFHGRRTASGQAHDKFKLTAAHRTLPFGTHLQVTNGRNGKSCVVVVNDRGPFGSQSLVLDVSKAAAHKLGFPGGGKIPVTCKVIDAKAGALALKDTEKDCGDMVAKAADAADAIKVLIAEKQKNQVPAKPATTPAVEKHVAAAPVVQERHVVMVPQVLEVKQALAVSSTQTKQPIASKPQEKIQIATKPQHDTFAGLAVTSHAGAKPHAVESTQSKTSIASKPPVAEAPQHGTFLLVINDTLENEHPAKTADFNPANNHQARAAVYAPTVFMKVDESAANRINVKSPATAPAVADGKILM